jgi:hypothetical protein
MLLIPSLILGLSAAPLLAATVSITFNATNLPIKAK